MRYIWNALKYYSLARLALGIALLVLALIVVLATTPLIPILLLLVGAIWLFRKTLDT